ncbi:cardiolipin synthase [Pasteurellaceae bacterium RH1A]|nr:cardiolipin synthase [Pasteurellaceae bacterium RH1A]
MPFSITWSEIFFALHFSVVLLCALRVLYHQRNTGAVLAWLLVLFAFPMVGVVAYLLIGEPRLGKKRLKRTAQINRFYAEFADNYINDREVARDHGLSIQQQGMIKMAENSTNLTANHDNSMQLLTTTDQITQAMLQDIEQAKQSCLLAFYIIEPQGKIAQVLEAVEAAAQRGVRCLILADAIGSSRFWRSEWVERLKAAGVFLQEALPVGLIRSLYRRNDLRNHRKILVVDYHIGYTGSFNLIDPLYFKREAGVGEWVDVMMRCTGSVVLEMAAVLYADVAVESEENLAQVEAYLKSYEQNPPILAPSQGSVVAQVIPSAPDQADSVIYDTILCAIHQATQRIVITTPYFVPNEPLLTALSTAARRGVEVTLILPAKVDSKMVRYASRAYFPMLLKQGVKIAEFEGGLLHTKTLVVDDDYTLFGTVNMDMRSFFLNLEISLAIYDREMTACIAALQVGYLAQSRYLQEKAWLARSKWWKLVENTVRLMSPLL